MVKGMVETIYKLKYFIFFIDEKNTGKKIRAQGKHREFCLDGSVATLNNIYLKVIL